MLGKACHYNFFFSFQNCIYSSSSFRRSSVGWDFTTFGLILYSNLCRYRLKCYGGLLFSIRKAIII